LRDCVIALLGIMALRAGFGTLAPLARPRRRLGPANALAGSSAPPAMRRLKLHAATRASVNNAMILGTRDKGLGTSVDTFETIESLDFVPSCLRVKCKWVFIAKKMSG